MNEDERMAYEMIKGLGISLRLRSGMTPFDFLFVKIKISLANEYEEEKLLEQTRIDYAGIF